MPNASVSFTVTFLITVLQRNESFFPILSSIPAFLSRLVCHINNSSKILVNLTNFATEKHSVNLGLNLSYKRKNDKKTHLLKRIFLYREKEQTKNFYPFLRKRLFDHRKEFLKNSQSTSKGSTSNLLQVAFLTRCGGKAGIALR